MGINNKLYLTLISWGLLSEICTVFLNDCYILVKEKRDKTPRFLLSSTALIATYTYFRIGTFTWIANIVYNTPELQQYIAFAFPLAGMNYLWYGMLCKKYVGNWTNYLQDGKIVSDPVVADDNN